MDQLTYSGPNSNCDMHGGCTVLSFQDLLFPFFFFLELKSIHHSLSTTSVMLQISYSFMSGNDTGSVADG